MKHEQLITRIVQVIIAGTFFAIGYWMMDRIIG